MCLPLSPFLPGCRGEGGREEEKERQLKGRGGAYKEITHITRTIVNWDCILFLS